jgi:cyclic beta-1,2-glucan synthetase
MGLAGMRSLCLSSGCRDLELINGKRLTGMLLRSMPWRRDGGWLASMPEEDAPLRSELFSADQMELHGKALAASHRLARGRNTDLLLPRLAANEEVLVGVCKLLTVAVTAKQRVTPAGEWLLDNFYLIEEQIRTAKRHLPKGYSRELPRLAHGPSAGRPRVYDLALETVAHGDGRVDTETLGRFVAAYQSVTELDLGELWAIPIMLRLAVIENLRRVSVRIAAGWTERNRAGSWADQMIEAAEKDPKSLILVIADMARSGPSLVSAFVAELVRRLQGQGPALALPLTWIEQRLAEAGLTIEHSVQSENQQQAANQVSISNSIGSLRVLGATDWREFVETMSAVERTLREDPGGVYAAMDFGTRDRYRHATERIAKASRLSEGAVARKAVELANAGAATGGSTVTNHSAGHVGFYLIAKGVAQLEAAADVHLPGAETLRRAAGRYPLLLYLGSVSLIAVLTTGILLAQALAGGMPVWAMSAAGLLILLAASQLGVGLANWLATLLVTPHPLPKMDFSGGIPATSRTLVVVPTMLTSVSGIEDLVEALEVRYLANKDLELRFGLLTDYCDAASELLEGDLSLVQLAGMRLDELNEKYCNDEGRTGGDLFFMFHRPRRWNPQEGLWMGYERKRGKLADLNALLRGGAPDAFSVVVGDISALSGVKYVITLDTDTQLPRDAARQIVGAMAHPLNRARYDPGKGRVCEGYGILQPRVSISLPGTNRSRYARLYGGEPGVDPYTRAVSDVYQDVFDEGSFIGKGIYDIDAFEQALGGRFPENLILSHDLLEGCHVRSALLSDVQLYEDYPSRYSADVTRRQRWIRGDWQLAGWLLRNVPGGRGRRKNPLSVLSQWKLIDNLRRSLVPAALTALLLLGWTLLAPAWVWTVAVIGILLVPSLCAALLDLLRKSDEVLLRQHLAAVAGAAYRRAMQFTFELACLPYEAYCNLDAIARTAWRMLVARKRLLEWNPSSEADRESRFADRDGLVSGFRTMWPGPVLAIAAVAQLATTPEVLAVASPILLLWFASPAIAWWLSRPLAPRVAALTLEQSVFLRGLARRTWAFFDNFVGAQDHWLPPDNYQEYRVGAIAHRTSPTNMGLALLANLSAYDFGYLASGRLVERTANTLRAMDGLERHRGHFYNWYDTETLQPLAPLYISTVDSGNLAGHLLTLRAGLLALGDDCVLPVRLFEGLSDTLRLLLDAMEDPEAGAAPVLRSSRLLTIGYNVGERRADTGYYDLLASEARLCSFVAIAQGQMPQESWFALGAC